jgi:Ulp1 family protease
LLQILALIGAVPYQDNSWDCGVFVCRYAAALQARRKDLFTFQDKSENFKKSVTRHPLFNFTMDDIAQLRQEVAALIDRLSILYKRQKEKEAEEKRLIKAARKKLLVAQEEEGK